jgi:transcriptional regulator with XRE-family HTH domain
MTGPELKQRRQRLGLSQRALADKMGVTTRSVSRWETGQVSIRPWVEKFVDLLETYMAAEAALRAGKRGGPVVRPK